MILFISSLLSIIEGVEIEFVCRFLAGFVYGFIYIVLVPQMADNSLKTVRGFIATSLSSEVIVGSLIGVFITQYPREYRAVSVLFPLTSLITTVFFTNEPVTRLLRLNLEMDARTMLSDSRKGIIDTTVIQHEIDEKKLMLMEDYTDDGSFSGFVKVLSNGNWIPLLWMCLLRLLNVLTNNIYLFILSVVAIYRDLSYVAFMGLLFTRSIILLIPKFSIDKLGRRSMLLVSGLGSGILLIPFAVQNMNYIQIRSDLFIIITCSIHIFAALGIESVQHIYVTEAFPLSTRNGSIAIVNCIEYICQAIIFVWIVIERQFLLQVLLIMTPFVVLLLTIVLFVNLPETKTMSLRRCQGHFNQKLVKKLLPSRLRTPHTINM